jgi:hypothetical protein
MGQGDEAAPFFDYIKKIGDAAIDEVTSKYQVTFLDADDPLSKEEVAAMYFKPMYARDGYGMGITFTVSDKTKFFKFDNNNKKVPATVDDIGKRSMVRVVCMIGPAWASKGKWGLKVRAEFVMIDGIAEMTPEEEASATACDNDEVDADEVFGS